MRFFTTPLFLIKVKTFFKQLYFLLYQQQFF